MMLHYTQSCVQCLLLPPLYLWLRRLTIGTYVSPFDIHATPTFRQEISNLVIMFFSDYVPCSLLYETWRKETICIHLEMMTIHVIALLLFQVAMEMVIPVIHVGIVSLGTQWELDHRVLHQYLHRWLPYSYLTVTRLRLSILGQGKFRFKATAVEVRKEAVAGLKWSYRSDKESSTKAKVVFF